MESLFGASPARFLGVEPATDESEPPAATMETADATEAPAATVETADATEPPAGSEPVDHVEVLEELGARARDFERGDSLAAFKALAAAPDAMTTTSARTTKTSSASGSTPGSGQSGALVRAAQLLGQCASRPDLHEVLAVAADALLPLCEPDVGYRARDAAAAALAQLCARGGPSDGAGGGASAAAAIAARMHKIWTHAVERPDAREPFVRHLFEALEGLERPPGSPSPARRPNAPLVSSVGDDALREVQWHAAIASWRRYQGDPPYDAHVEPRGRKKATPGALARAAGLPTRTITALMKRAGFFCASEHPLFRDKFDMLVESAEQLAASARAAARPRPPPPADPRPQRREHVDARPPPPAAAASAPPARAQRPPEARGADAARADGAQEYQTPFVKVDGLPSKVDRGSTPISDIQGDLQQLFTDPKQRYRPINITLKEDHYDRLVAFVKFARGHEATTALHDLQASERALFPHPPFVARARARARATRFDDARRFLADGPRRARTCAGRRSR